MKSTFGHCNASTASPRKCIRISFMRCSFGGVYSKSYEKSLSGKFRRIVVEATEKVKLHEILIIKFCDAIIIEVESAKTPAGKRTRETLQRDFLYDEASEAMQENKRGGSSVCPRKAKLIPLHVKGDLYYKS